MINTRILVAILATEESPWIDIEKFGQDITWKMNPPTGTQVIRYTSEQKKDRVYFSSEILWNLSRFKILTRLKYLRSLKNYWNKYLNNLKPDIDQNGSTVLIHLPEAYSLIGLKTIKFFEYALNNYQFEYLYRTNVSSYVDLSTLSKAVSALNCESPIYGGVEGFEKETSFASGSGYLIDRDSLKRVVSNKSKWDNFEIDDVALGKIIKNELKLSVTKFKRTDIPFACQANLSNVGISGVFHYRCKAKNALETIAIMKRIRELLTNDI